MPVDRVLLEEYLVRTLWAVGVVAVAILLATGLRRGAIAALLRRHAHSSAVTLIGDSARALILVAGGLVIVAIYSGDAFGWILGSFSVIGIVVGLSLQDLLRNFFAGVWILIEQPIRIGDTVEIAGYSGVVEEIAFRVTRLRAPDGRIVIVPNANLMTGTIVNLTRSSARRVAVAIELPSGEVGEQLAAIGDVLAGIAGVLGDPRPTIELHGVAGGRARYFTSFWSLSPDPTRTETLRALRSRFPEAEAHAA